MEKVQKKIWFYLRSVQTQIDEIWLKKIQINQSIFIFFGDSRAKAWLKPTGFSKFSFLNRGISLETTFETLRRFDKHILPLLPDILLVQTGVNDFKAVAFGQTKPEIPISNCIDNIRKIVDLTSGSVGLILLTTIFPIGKNIPAKFGTNWIPDVRRAIRRVNEYLINLRRSNVVIIDSHSVLANHDGFLRSEYVRDFLHPNQLGYEALNVNLKEVLKNYR